MIPQAITTHYNGYKFRSRLEARWAVFFDNAGLKYEYEKEGFVLSDGLTYLPDFWLPEWGLWLEVKSATSLCDDLLKPRAFSSEVASILVVVGEPWWETPIILCRKTTEGDVEVAFSFNPITSKVELAALSTSSIPDGSGRFFRFGLAMFELEDAYIAARSARFEHGEKG